MIWQKSLIFGENRLNKVEQAYESDNRKIHAVNFLEMSGNNLQ